MVEGEYVSIQEAARRCGVSGKTIQRAIQAGKLPAQYPKPNQCQIAISDLERFRPGQVSGQTTDLLESRIIGMEERIEQLEHLVAALLSKQEAQKDASELRTEQAKKWLGLLVPLSSGLSTQNESLQESQSLARTTRVVEQEAPIGWWSCENGKTDVTHQKRDRNALLNRSNQSRAWGSSAA